MVSEKIRWGESVAQFKEQEKTLCGDVLLVTAFVSYVGYFTRKYRNDLLNNCWMPFLEKLEVWNCIALFEKLRIDGIHLETCLFIFAVDIVL